MSHFLPTPCFHKGRALAASLWPHAPPARQRGRLPVLLAWGCHEQPYLLPGLECVVAASCRGFRTGLDKTRWLLFRGTRESITLPPQSFGTHLVAFMHRIAARIRR